MSHIAPTAAEAVSRPDREPAPARGRSYLYAVVAARPDHIPDCLGINGAPVYAISDGQVAAIVSDLPCAKIRPERRHLAVHQEVLKRLLEQTTPLPMSFGIVARDPKAVLRILSENRDAFLRQLHRVEGKLEMGLRAVWDVPNIFEYFVDVHTELRAARDRFLGAHHEPSQDDRIEVGRLFDRILNEDREAYAGEVEHVLAPCCFEVKRAKCRNEREVMNLACLVGREEVAVFEEAVFRAARLFDNHFAFDYNGPWAPHNFVDLELVL
jgi:hypothetical protein